MGAEVRFPTGAWVATVARRWTPPEQYHTKIGEAVRLFASMVLAAWPEASDAELLAARRSLLEGVRRIGPTTELRRRLGDGAESWAVVGGLRLAAARLLEQPEPPAHTLRSTAHRLPAEDVHVCSRIAGACSPRPERAAWLADDVREARASLLGASVRPDLFPRADALGRLGRAVEGAAR